MTTVIVIALIIVLTLGFVPWLALVIIPLFIVALIRRFRRHEDRGDEDSGDWFGGGTRSGGSNAASGREVKESD